MQQSLQFLRLSLLAVGAVVVTNCGSFVGSETHRNIDKGGIRKTFTSLTKPSWSSNSTKWSDNRLRLFRRSTARDYGSHFSVENYTPPQLSEIFGEKQQPSANSHDAETGESGPRQEDTHNNHVPEGHMMGPAPAMPMDLSHIGHLLNSGDFLLPTQGHEERTDTAFAQTVSPLVPRPIPDWPPMNNAPLVETMQNNRRIDTGFPIHQHQLQQRFHSVPSETHEENFQAPLYPLPHTNPVFLQHPGHDQQRQFAPEPTQSQPELSHADGSVIAATAAAHLAHAIESVLQEGQLQSQAPSEPSPSNPSLQLSSLFNDPTSETQQLVNRADYFDDDDLHDNLHRYSHGYRPGKGWHHHHHVRKEELVARLVGEVAWTVITSYIFVFIANAFISIVGKYLGLSDSSLEAKIKFGKDGQHPFEHYGSSSGGGGGSGTSYASKTGNSGPPGGTKGGWGWNKKDTYYLNNPLYHPSSALYHHPTYQYYPKSPKEYTLLGYDQYHAAKYAKKFAKKYSKKAGKYGLKPKPILPYIPAYNYGKESVAWGRDDEITKDFKKSDKLGKPPQASYEKSSEEKDKSKPEVGGDPEDEEENRKPAKHEPPHAVEEENDVVTSPDQNDVGESESTLPTVETPVVPSEGQNAPGDKGFPITSTPASNTTDHGNTTTSVSPAETTSS